MSIRQCSAITVAVFQFPLGQQIPEDFGDPHNALDELAKRIAPAQIIISDLNEAGINTSVDYLQKQLDERNLQYETLPFEDDVFCLRPTGADTLNCITGPGFLSPNGDPIFYHCGDNVRGLRNGSRSRLRRDLRPFGQFCGHYAAI